MFGTITPMLARLAEVLTFRINIRWNYTIVLGFNTDVHKSITQLRNHHRQLGVRIFAGDTLLLGAPAIS